MSELDEAIKQAEEALESDNVNNEYFDALERLLKVVKGAQEDVSAV